MSGRPDAPAERLGGGKVEQPGDEGRVHGCAQDGAGPQQLLQVGTGPVEPREHRGLQCLGDAGAGRAPQRLDNEQRVPAGAGVDLACEVGASGRGGQLGDRGLRQRPDVDPRRHVGQRREDVGPLLHADRRDREQPGRTGPAREVVQQLDPGPAGVVQVVEDQEERPFASEGGQHVRHGLEGSPPFRLRARPARLGAAEGVGEVGQQLRQRGGPRPGEAAHGVRGEGAQHLSERLGERLEEQRALGGVAAGDDGPAAGRLGGRGRRLGQGGLADAGFADQEDDRRPSPACGLPGRRRPGELVGTPDHPRRALKAAPVRSRGCRPVGLAFLAQHGEMGAAGLGRRFDAELVAQRDDQPLVGRQRQRRLAEHLVGAHQQSVRGLVEPVVVDGGTGQVDGDAGPSGTQRRRGAVMPGGP